MAMHKIDLKSRYGSVMQFSTSAAAAGAAALQFSSADEAAAFLTKHFTDYSYARGLLAVASWMDIADVNLQVHEAKKQLFLQLGQAIQQAKLFVRELPAAERQQDSAAVVPASKAATPKANKPGGAAQSSNTGAGPAVNDETGTNGSGTKTPKRSEVECAGDPVSMCTGEEILELIDFDLSGPLPLQFKRTYRSSQCHEQLGLGYGWRSNFHLHIEATKNAADEPRLVLHDDEGRRLFFTPVAPGQTSHQLAEGLALRHEDNGSQVLLRPDNTHWVFVPANTDIKQPKRWVLHQIFDSLGNVLQLYYDRYQRLSRIDYTRKRGIELHYDKQGLISRIEAVENTPEGLKALDVVLAQYHFDAERDLIAATNQAGQTEHYGYQGHLLAVRQRASGFKHYFSWLGEGPAARCSRNWGDDGYYDYQFQYDDNQRLAISTDSRGQRWQYFHNERNQLIKKVAPDGAIWRYTWNNLGKKIAETAPNGAATRYYYNDVGQLVTVEQADGAISHFQYNELGQRTGFTDAEGQHWRREYSAGGLLKAQYQPDGSSSRYQYNTEGQLTQLQHADGRIEQYLWNEEGQLLARKQGDAVSRYSYDKLGRLNGIAYAAGLVTEYQRNTAGNVTEIRQYPADAPEQVSVEQLSYDAAGRLISKTNAQGEQSQWQYEGLAQPTALIQADGSRFSYEYDKERNLTAIMRSDGARYQLDYDGLERPVKLQGFDGRVQHYQYDIAGHVSNVADGSKRQVKLKRDSLGRITEQTALFGQQLASNHFHYDKLGRPLRASNAQRKLRFSYHANGQLSEHWQDDWRTVHQYDNAGRRLSTILPDGTALDYRYNEQGLLSQLAVNQQPVMWRSFDNAGRETAREYQSGLQLNQQFDAFNRLTAQHWQLGEKSRQRQYRYSTLHQLLAVTDNQSGDIEYQYNKLDQLVSKQHSKDASQNEQHQWDSFGNPTGEGIEVQQDRLLRYHDNQYQYDDNGNQLTALAAGKRQQRQFNGFNQLTGLQDVSGVTRYEYDAFGRRSAKITAAGRTDYLWEGNTLIGEYCQGEYRWYVFEPNSNKPLALISRGQLYFYQLDQLGTPLSLTDSENNIVWQAHYTVFGKATVTVNNIDNPIRFQGQYYDSESGLHYNHFRYYDPETGRFISQDPIGLLGGINHYQYAPNHINWIDPLGLCAKEEGSVGLLDGIVGTVDLVVTGVVNTGVDIVAGGAGLVTLAISGGNVDAAVHTIESVQEKQIGLLSQAGEKVAGVVAPVVDKYYEQNMAALGDATMEATGSPMLATAAHKSVELVGTVLGAGVVGKSLKNGAKIAPNSADSFARSVLNKASQAEPEVTSFLSDLSQAAGGRLEGLDFALKSEASLSRKISTVSEKYNLSLAEAAADINDALRYTMILDSKSFGNNVVEVFESLDKAGHKKKWVTNTFLDESASYKGVNATFETPEGQLFELQFHTSDSFDVKQNINHALYEEARLLSTSTKRVSELNDQMLLNSAKIPQPNGVELINNYRPSN